MGCTNASNTGHLTLIHMETIIDIFALAVISILGILMIYAIPVRSLVGVRTLKQILVASLAVGVILPVSKADAVSYPTDTVPSTTAPWVAAIFLGISGNDVANIERTCTGSLIDSRHVLTSAHCVVDRHPSDLTVALGGNSLTESSLYQVADYEVHHRYTIPTNDTEISLPHDIALMRLTEPVIGITPVRLAPSNDLAMRTAKVGMALYGWGANQNGALGEYLGYTKQLDFSAKARRWFDDFTPQLQIAAGLSRKQEKIFSGACFGDSGGPLVGFDTKRVPHVLGVVSYGAGDCKTSAPSVYTRVAKYRSWVDSARRKMIERVGRTLVEYGVEDREGDAVGSYGNSVDISYGYIVSTTTLFTAKVYLPTTRNVLQIPLIVLIDHSGDYFAIMSETGVVDTSRASVCASTSRLGYDPDVSSSYMELATSTDCLYRTFGRSSFDVDVVVGAYLSGDTSTSVGTDDLRIWFVSLYLP